MFYRQTVEGTASKSTLMRFAVGILSYVINYVACGFLAPVLLITLVAIVFSYTAIIRPETPFIQNFAPVLQTNPGKTIRLNGEDIMRGVGYVTTALFLLSLIGNETRRFFKRHEKQTSLPDGAETIEDNQNISKRGVFSKFINKRRIIITSIVITAIFALSIIMIPHAHLAEGESSATWYVIFIVLYIIVLVLNGIYMVTGSISDKLYEWATS